MFPDWRAVVPCWCDGLHTLALTSVGNPIVAVANDGAADMYIVEDAIASLPVGGPTTKVTHKFTNYVVPKATFATLPGGTYLPDNLISRKAAQYTFTFSTSPLVIRSGDKIKLSYPAQVAFVQDTTVSGWTCARGEDSDADKLLCTYGNSLPDLSSGTVEVKTTLRNGYSGQTPPPTSASIWRDGVKQGEYVSTITTTAVGTYTAAVFTERTWTRDTDVSGAVAQYTVSFATVSPIVDGYKVKFDLPPTTGYAFEGTGGIVQAASLQSGGVAVAGTAVECSRASAPEIVCTFAMDPSNVVINEDVALTLIIPNFVNPQSSAEDLNTYAFRVVESTNEVTHDGLA